MTSGGQDTQALLDALASPVRREILWLIWDTEMAAGDVAATFELSAPTISGHLAVLREAGLVDMRRDGTFRRYRARPDAMPGLRDIVRLDDGKWHPGSTPAPLAAHRTMAVAVAEVDAACDQATAYRAFTDARLYSRWAGVPVTLDDGRFSCTMEWGLNVRGTYDIVAPPSLIVMRWDFESDQVPLPGDGLRAYLEFQPRPVGCHLQLHQLVRSEEQARYMERAWGLMLARFRDHVLAAVAPDVAIPMRPRRARSRPGDPAGPRG